MIAAGGPIYSTYRPTEIYISMLCHGTIYFCGFVAIGTETYSVQDMPKLALGVALVAVHAAVLGSFVAGHDQFLIYILLDAIAIRQLLPQSAWMLALPVSSPSRDLCC